MKKNLINILLTLVAIAALTWCTIATGILWFPGFVVLLAACYGLLAYNTDYIKYY